MIQELEGHVKCTEQVQDVGKNGGLCGGFSAGGVKTISGAIGERYSRSKLL